MSELTPAARPTLYFIGVTTAKSSIMKVFPAWAEHLGLSNAGIKGIDFPLHAEPDAYRAAVRFIKRDPLSLGALVTTHKIDLYKACREFFDEIDLFARVMEETSCLSKRGGKFVCHAKDPISSGLALQGFLPKQHFARTRAELFAIGAGGSTIAFTWYLSQPELGAERPSRIVVSDRSPERLAEVRRIHRELGVAVPVDYVVAAGLEDNDAVVAGMKPGSLVVNATGLGKDAPGSPVSDAVRFPEGGIVWDLNYRGDLVFLHQARSQQAARNLQVENGWTYFIHGWTQVIAEVFHVAIPTSGPGFDAIAAIAAKASAA
jgi:shikimate 5-dehydrogenase